MPTPLTPQGLQTPRITRHLRASDLRAAALLATQATQAVAAITEGVHQSVWRTLGAPAGATPATTRGLTGLVYQSIQEVTQGVGLGLASALARLEPLLQKLSGEPAHGDDPLQSTERLAVLAALNGTLGDRLAASDIPLAFSMTLRFQELPVLVSKGLALDLPLKNQLPAATPWVLLVLHGLCMNDLQWNQQQGTQQVNHARVLADTLGCTPIYLRYNTGLHISANARLLAHQLEQLLQCWPVALTRLSVLAHSMGGLVMRSAIEIARQEHLRWPVVLHHLVFLGTPHHGAPLERAGNWVDVLLGSTPYSRPFTKLAQLRSAGITDLRYGLVQDQDWLGHDRFRRTPDRRTPLPLPAGVACFTVAATLAARRGVVAERLLGDGLVPLRSALGQHDDPRHNLQFAPRRQLLLYRTGHLQLLSSPAVTQQLLRWLGP